LREQRQSEDSNMGFLYQYGGMRSHVKRAKKIRQKTQKGSRKLL
jgi:hypothetical protein